jgi:ubiquinone/menaquinone biosynthesis C-methylase UbiE
VLDAGCGNGRYLAALRGRSHRGPVIGVDRSPGMLAAAGAGRLAVGDVQALPFPDGAFDAALAMHMLYHVPERRAALAELRRVVRPGGVVLALTNSETHLRELDEIFHVSARAFLTFTSENGAAELSEVFARVELHEFVSELVLTDVEPVLAYARSMSAFAPGDDGGPDPGIDDIAVRVAAVIAREGAFRARTAVGCFVCR